ncbi:hypothetical protein H257_10149 [Aphanomyces astaci]|uniref:Uncharacterized protein n=1 Tax=Aphanomyces astaci TaxID=112090 RepID=W4G9Z9_APHAT|nr:hypothetical protein H257_10149 [Aphanomyces astaci]ETV75778.1 hypothetical protein H257_10149 [Aphanomyces astaci]|eukprot:XP_009834909.1 hypothetical protein H257_10149 [Aphanomyces astaci]
MNDVRWEEHILTSLHMLTFMKQHYKDSLQTYTAAKLDTRFFCGCAKDSENDTTSASAYPLTRSSPNSK